MTRETLLLKRRRIERGEMTEWLRRGRIYHSQARGLRDRLLQQALHRSGLYRRGVTNACTPKIKRLHFSFANLPEAFDGFTILHLTDLHIDGVPGLADNLHDCIQDLEVDLCVLTGDYRFKTRGPCDQVYPPMARLLSGVHARHGTVGILGNHDWFEMVPEFERMGVKMLVNDAHEVRRHPQSIWVLGVDDPHYYGCDDLPAALHDVPLGTFKILLVHTPELYLDAAQHDIQLYLCGHTHGGQIALPWLGPIFTNANNPRRFSHGQWHYNNMQGYTNIGAGASGVPVRFFCQSEVGLITLRRTAARTHQAVSHCAEPVSIHGPVERSSS